MALCPYCEKEVSLESSKKDNIDNVQRDVKGLLKKEVMYSCPHCKKILGFSFFIGGWITGRP